MYFLRLIFMVTVWILFGINNIFALISKVKTYNNINRYLFFPIPHCMLIHLYAILYPDSFIFHISYTSFHVSYYTHLHLYISHYIHLPSYIAFIHFPPYITLHYLITMWVFTLNSETVFTKFYDFFIYFSRIYI